MKSESLCTHWTWMCVHPATARLGSGAAIALQSYRFAHCLLGDDRPTSFWADRSCCARAALAAIEYACICTAPVDIRLWASRLDCASTARPCPLPPSRLSLQAVQAHIRALSKVSPPRPLSPFFSRRGLPRRAPEDAGDLKKASGDKRR